MIHALVGTEALLIRRELERLLEELPPAARSFNLDQWDGKELEAARVMDVARTYPILSPKRMILIRDAHEIRKSEMDALSDFLPELPRTTDLILVADKCDRKFSFWKRVEEAGRLREFKPLYPREVPGWLAQETKARGYSLTQEAAQWLTTAVGTDLGGLVATLEKLCLLKGADRKITLADVESCVTASSWKNLFDLTDAAGKKDLPLSLRLFHRMEAAGEAPVALLGLLARHFRILSRVKEGETAGVPPYFLKDYQSQARTFSVKALAEKRERLFETDRALKSSPIPSSIIFERLLMDLCR